MSPNIEAIFAALFTLLQGAYAWQTSSRRIKLWTDVDAAQMPALYQFEGGDEQWIYENDLLQRVVLECVIVVYVNAIQPAGSPNMGGATQINNILTALRTALAPTGADQFTGRQTLGGLCSSCRVDGKVFKDPGDLDGIGAIRIPIRIVWP